MYLDYSLMISRLLVVHTMTLFSFGTSWILLLPIPWKPMRKKPEKEEKQVGETRLSKSFIDTRVKNPTRRQQMTLISRYLTKITMARLVLMMPITSLLVIISIVIETFSSQSLLLFLTAYSHWQ